MNAENGQVMNGWRDKRLIINNKCRELISYEWLGLLKKKK